MLGVALALLGATERAAAQTAPGAPTIEAVAGTTNTLTVIWSAPLDDGGATISAYHLRYTEGDPTNMDDANWTFRRRAWTSNSGSLSYVVSGLRGDTAYGVQVQAVNSNGPGAWSDPVSGTTTDYGDTATTAAALVVSATTPAVVAARIGSETDKDVFSFVLTEDAELMVRSTGPVDVAGEVLNEDLTSAGANNNARFPDNPWNFLIHRYLTAGTYYASVAGHDGATGPYEIHVEILPDDIPDYFGAAASVSPGLVTAGRVGRFDSDYYKLEFSERTDFYIVVFSGHSTSGQLFDANETLLAESKEYYLQDELFLSSFSSINDTGFMLRGTGRAGTYYIEVRSTSNNDRGSYVMQVGEAPNPGRTLGTATPILPGAGAPGRIAPASDADYFSISFDEDTAATVVAATVEYLMAYQVMADLEITVYDEQNTPLDFHSIPHSAWEDIGNGYVAGHAFGLFEAGKTYKIRVRANAGERAAYFLLFRPEEAYTSFATQCSALTADDAIDTFYGCQWHLNNTGQFPGGAIHDINVEEVWQAGNTGAGVSIAVVDTGLHFEHPDLNDNVDRTRNFDYLSMEYEGAYIHLPFHDSHGTAVAGLIAAEHNDIGVRGVAPEATIYSHNYLDSYQTLAEEADAMTRDRVTTHISSNSWGPGDNGTPEPSPSTWDMAIETGLREGDEGRGISYVFAGGNGSRPDTHDNSNLDGYANFYGVTAVCAIDHNDVRSSYSEPGANLWVCAPSSGADPPDITTTDVGGAFAFFGDDAGSGYWPGLYTDTFGGTSAAAPIVSGVVALMRSANPALTWRDVKLILAASARENDLADSGWERGALRYGSDTGYYWFNHQYGFGAVDAGAAVALANRWTNVAPMRTGEVTSDDGEVAITTFGTPSTQTVTFSDSDVDFIEFVEITVDLDHLSFRDLKIELESPSGATSVLVHSAQLRFSLFGIDFGPLKHTHEGAIRFGSAKHLGENPDGEWTLRITDELLTDWDGTLKNFRLKVYGHTPAPGSVATPSATTVGDALRVTWTAPGASTAPANSYDVRYIPSDADKADPNWTVVTGVWTAGDLSYDLTGLTHAVRYDVQVRAVNVPQPGPWSETVIGIVGAAPGVLLTPATLTVPEGGSMTYTVELASQPTADVTVAMSQSGSTDVTHSDDSLTFTTATWVSPQTVTVSAAHDADYDDDTATISHSVTSTDTDYQGISGGAVEVTVEDDEKSPLTVSFGASTYTIAEGRSEVVTVRLSPEPDRMVTIPFDRRHEGGATSADYTGVPDSVVFNSGVKEQTFTVTAVNDTVNDDDEYIDLVFGMLPTGVTAGSPSETSIKITDDDFPDAVTVRFEKSSYNVAESDDSTTPDVFENQVELTVTLSADPDRTVRIPLIPTNHGARDVDYSIVPTVLTFNDGDTEMTSTFTAAHDGDDDDDESVAIGFGNLPTGVIRGDGTTVNIADDDDPRVRVSFAGATYSVPEGGSVEVTVTLSADPERTVDIPLSAAGRGGLEDAEYSVVPEKVTFSTGGSLEQTVTVTTTDDRINDDGESLRLTFGTLPGRVTSTSPSAATVSINDDDVAGVTLSETSLGIAEGGSGDYTVVLTSEPTSDVTIEFNAPSGSDLRVSPASHTFTNADWETLQTVTVSAVHDDGFSNDTGTITHRVRSSDSDYNNRSVDSVAVTVDDDEEVPVTVKFGRANYTVAEGGTVDVTVTLNRDPKRTVTIPIETDNQNGADYSGVPSSVTFISPDTSETIIFEATQDSDDDDGESVRLSFGGLPDAVTAVTPSASTISITDDDHPIVDVSFEKDTYDVNEGGSVDVMLMLSEAPGRSVTIQIDKTDSGATTADYSVPGAVTFGRNDTEKSISFSATQDSINDDNESVRLTLSSTLPDRVEAVSPSSTTVSINDDDGPGVLITPTALTVPEGRSRTYTVKLTSEPTASVTVNLSTSGSTTVTHDATNNMLTFTAANWATNQTVRVSAAEDDADHDDETATISHSVTSADGDYQRITPPDINVAVTVTDDEEVPVEVSFDRATYVIDEGADRVVRVTLDVDPERTVTIPFVKTEVGATSADYGGVPSSVTFRSGDTEQMFTVTTVNDTVDDDDERIELSFGTPLPEAVTTGSFGATSIQITDDDAPEVTVSFEKSSYRVAEGESVEVTVTLTVDPKRDVTVEIRASGQGGATEQNNTGADYFGVPPSVTFNDGGELSQSFTITAVNDTVDDDGESVAIGFGNLPPGVLRGDGTTVTIDDDDDPDVVVSFGAAAYEVTEGASVRVIVELNKDPERQVVIPITASNRGTTSDQDYSGVPIITGVTFESGDTEKEISFGATQDTLNDDGESVVIEFGSPLPTQVSISRGTLRSTRVTIVDDDAPNVTVNFERTEYEVDEGSSVTVKVTLSRAPERTVTIPILKTELGATSADYGITPGLSLTFASDETEQTLTFTAASDDLDDDGESVKLAIGNVPTGVARGDDSEATVTILDDPVDVPAVTVNFASRSYTVAEDQTAANHTVEVTLTLSVDPERTVVIPIVRTNERNASDADYVPPPSRVTFASDETEQTLTFTPVDDAIDDDGERVRLALGAPPRLVTNGATKAATVSITDNDTRGVTVTPTSLRILEGGPDPGEYTVVLDSEPTGDVTVVITPPTNADITVNRASLLFTPSTWKDEQTMTVTAVQESDPTDDADDTGTITHTVRSSGDYASVRAAAVSVTVLDDEDPQVRVEFDRVTGTVAEGGGAITFTVTLSKDPERTVTIPIRVAHHDGASSSDYTLSVDGVAATSVTFNSRQQSKQITLTAVDDMFDDDGESVTLGFGGLPGGVAEGTDNEVTVSITDNDAPSVTVRFEQTTYTIDEGDSFSINVILSPDPEGPVTIPIEFESEDAAQGRYGLPVDVMFTDGQTTESINFTATNDDVDDDSRQVIVRFGTASRDNVAAGNETTVRITDNDQRGVSVTPAILTVDEGFSDSYDVVLTSEPTGDVSVEITPPANTDITVRETSLTFGPGNWDTPKPVTVSAAHDDPEDAEDDTGTITHDVSGGDYDSVSVGSVSVSVTVDDDEVSVSFERAAYSVAEGGDAVTVTVRLSAPAKQMFVIDLVTTDQVDGATADDYSTLPGSLTFEPGDTEQSFGFSALPDDQDDEGESVLLEFGTLPPGVIAGSPAQATLTISGGGGGGGGGAGGGAGGGGGGGGGPSPSGIEFEWNVTRDIETLDSGHEAPTGAWSDGTLLWIAENGDGADDAVYAYDLVTGERVEEREFELDESNRAPRGLWSNGKTAWVADSGQDRLFAYDLESGERVEEREVELDTRNRDPRGIWSDGTIVWVLDGGKNALFAYDLASGELIAEYALDDANGDPRGLWSDGVTVWVSDHGAKRLFAYRLAAPDAETTTGEDEEAAPLERARDEEFTELSRASNNSPRGIWSDGEVMYVADESDGRVYSYNLPDAIDARLASLTLSGVEFGEFDPGVTEYQGVPGDGVTETTVAAEATQRRASVSIEPPDANLVAEGHQVAIEDISEITVTVTSADESRTKVYIVRFGDAAEAEQPVVACLRGAITVGFSLVVAEGGNVEELVNCAQSRSVTALYVPHEGEYVSYILGAPDFVNEEFVALYRDGLPALAPLIAKSAGPPSPAPASGDVPEFGPDCLRGAIATGFSLVLYEGGSVDALDACAQSREVSAVYALHDGEYVSYILGAPDFVNAAFRELFADGLPAVTPLVVKSN